MNDVFGDQDKWTFTGARVTIQHTRLTKTMEACDRAVCYALLRRIPLPNAIA